MKYQMMIKIILLTSLLFGCSASSPLLEPDNDDLAAHAPSEFSVEFNTTKGNILVEVKRENSPLAVDRFYYLVKNNYYNYNRFFRVLPNFVVQWGMRGVPIIDKAWENLGIEDEPVKLSNTKGTISFARAGVNSRSNQLFINLGDNIRLDTSNFNDVNGFPAFGKVIKGMDVVESINSEYMQEPNQDSISVRGNIYLKKNYPNLDYIISTKIINQ
jgi:peptidyl-prolyl cis-trans isomerase A (cyclophilin A)